MRRMLDLVIGAIRHVLQGRLWQKAFDQTGFGKELSIAYKFIRHQIRCEDLPGVPAVCPTALQLPVFWPRNRPFNEALVMACLAYKLLALEDLPSPMVALGGGGPALLPLPAAAGASLLVQELAVGREIVPQMEIADLEHAATPGVADSGERIVANPSGASLPIPKTLLFK